MGFEVHITRAKWYFENEGHWITADEWLRYVESDPELKLAGHHGDYFVLWSGETEYPNPWLDWLEGDIYCKAPDDAMVDKMIAIAKHFNAKVQNDDGEVYPGPGCKNVLPPPD